MERYFFHIDYGVLEHDGEGTPFPSLADARANAVALLSELLRDAGDEFWAKPNITITVTDAAGLVLWTLDASGQASAAMAGTGKP